MCPQWKVQCFWWMLPVTAQVSCDWTSWEKYFPPPPLWAHPTNFSTSGRCINGNTIISQNFLNHKIVSQMPTPPHKSTSPYQHPQSLYHLSLTSLPSLPHPCQHHGPNVKSSLESWLRRLPTSMSRLYGTTSLVCPSGSPPLTGLWSVRSMCRASSMRSWISSWPVKPTGSWLSAWLRSMATSQLML